MDSVQAGQRVEDRPLGRVDWTDDLRESLNVTAFTSWASIFTSDLKGGQWEVRALLNIQDIDEKSRKALEKVLTAQMVQSLNLPPQIQDRESECRK